MIYITTIDDLVSFEDSPIQWNHMHMMHRLLFKNNNYSFFRNGKTNIFVMGAKTFRNLPYQLNYMCLVLSTRTVSEFANCNVKYIRDIDQIPRNSFTDVWFLGGESIFSGLCEYMDEILKVQYFIDSNDIWKNHNFCKKFFRVPQTFELKSENKKEFYFDVNLNRNVLCKIYFYFRKVNAKEDDAAENHRFILDSRSMIKYECGKVFKIACEKGFPIFGRNVNFINYVFVETWKFLNGSPDSYAFCNHYKLIMDMTADNQCDIHSIVTMNQDNIQVHFFSILNWVVNDMHFSENCSLYNSIFYMGYLPVQVFGRCKKFEVQLCFHRSGDVGALFLSMVVTVLETNYFLDYPFVVTSLAFLMFAVTNYLNQNRLFVHEIIPKEIIIMVGKCFYMIADEICIQDFVQYPVLLCDNKKPVQNYDICDFQINL